jgi:hypothetical protein
VPVTFGHYEVAWFPIHVLKIMWFSGFDLGNRECENPSPKVEIPSPENHVLKTIS